MNQELIDQIRKIVERVLREQTPVTTQDAKEKRLLVIFGCEHSLNWMNRSSSFIPVCKTDWKITIILSRVSQL